MRFKLSERTFNLKNIFLLFYISQFIIMSLTYSQVKSVMPTQLPGKNSVKFDKPSNTYKFYFNDILCYEYSILPDTTNNGGTFNVLRAFADDGTSFLPSNFGGVRGEFKNVEISPWDSGVSYILLNNQILPGDTVQVYWLMTANNESIKYKYKFKLNGRTLSIHTEIDDKYVNKAVALDLDRCEGAVKPSIVEVPYLPLFHVLFANNMFTSFFADWEVSNASLIVPYDGSKYSNSSLRYSQMIRYNYKTNMSRNKMVETLYLTTASKIENVFPNIMNPVSEYRDTSANYIIWDVREPYHHLISPSAESYMDKIYEAGVRNIWIQIHNWQHAGYDQQLPCVLPANPRPGYDGSSALRSVIEKARAYGYRVGLHQNYVDYYPDAKFSDYGYSPSDVALNSDGSFIKAYNNGTTQSVLLKPSKALYYLDFWSKAIQDSFPLLNGSYLDVHSSLNPSVNYIDYDTSVSNAGMFRETLRRYRELYPVLRKNNNGPVQGEGGNQLFYQGYADDIEARIIRPTNWSGGYNFPLLVDFDMLKLRDKAFVHGSGYITTFNAQKKLNPNTEDVSIVNEETVLSYIATELAYGHGGYLPAPGRVSDILQYAVLTYKHVFSVQKDIADAKPVLIQYNDNGELKSASEYIRNHPLTYANINSPDFMGQVRVEYSNGVVVYVNRHQSRTWDNINVGKPNGWFNYNANGKRETGISSSTKFNLPVKNGWVVYDPLKNK